jgi:hypothetical protein
MLNVLDDGLGDFEYRFCFEGQGYCQGDANDISKCIGFITGPFNTKVAVGNKISCTVFQDLYCIENPKKIEKGTNAGYGSGIMYSFMKDAKVIPQVRSARCVKEL